MAESDNCSEEFFSCREDFESLSSDLEDSISSSCDSPWIYARSPEYYRRWDGHYVMEWNEIPYTPPYATSSASSSRSSMRMENLDVPTIDLLLESKKLLEAKDGVRTRLKDERKKHLVDRAVIDEVQSWSFRVDESIKLRNKLLCRPRPKFPMNLLQSKQRRNRDASEKKRVILELMETFLKLNGQVDDLIDAINKIPQPSSHFRRIELQPHASAGEDFILFFLRTFVEYERGMPIKIIPPLYDLTEKDTRMLQEFHNKLGDEWKDTGDTFDIVIWLKVASLPTFRIQDDIAERFNSSFVGSETSDERAMILHNSLSNYRFLMILGQVESVLNLEKVGIPRPHRESKCSKIIVASPSLDVCKSMGLRWYDITLSESAALILDRKIKSYVSSVVSYEDPPLQRAARETTPVDEIEENALISLREKGVLNPSQEERKHEFLLQLLFWFDQSFKWVEVPPPCQSCRSSTWFLRSGNPLRLEEGADTVEIYACYTCGEDTRFPRYNDPQKLILGNRHRGRGREWVNSFTLYCRALGYDSRLVVDFTHRAEWTECFSPLFGRWLRLDSCRKMDEKSPKLLEEDEYPYVIAFSKDGAYDVTKQTYPRKWDEFCSKRGQSGQRISAFLSEITDFLQNRRNKESQQL